MASKHDDAVPFLDLVTPHVELEEELLGLFRQILRSGRFAGGPAVEEFERDFAQFCGSRYCVGVSNGTDALRFALIAAGVGKGDAAITAPSTFIATVEAIAQCGALPEFVDVEEETNNIDPEKLRKFLETECDRDSKSGRPVIRRNGKVVAALVPVHLYGRMADMDAITELAGEYNLTVIEDACQAHGAEYSSVREGRRSRAGSVGRAAAFSFYPGKNLGACGEAGAVTTDDEGLADRVRMLRDHGQKKKYFHDVEGYNGRLDAMQAAVLKLKLGHLDRWTERRRAIARRYTELLRDCPEVRVPEENGAGRPVYHLYVIRVKERDALQEHLARLRIASGLHYPQPIHLQKAYAWLGWKEGDFPVAEEVAREILSLPMYPELKDEQVERVAGAIREYFSRPRSAQPSASVMEPSS